MDWVRLEDKGLFCEPAGVWLDPWRPVEKAVITHAHSDHARPGHGSYLCSERTAPVLKSRILGAAIQTLKWGETILLNSVSLSLHPAGHIPGSAQIRLEYKGEVCVFTGDYKLQHDGLSEPFEPVQCHRFITECTFGMPVFRWPDPEEVALEMLDWIERNAAEDKPSLLSVYSLGKAQRVMKLLENRARFFVHPTIDVLNKAYASSGLTLPESEVFRSNASFQGPCLFLAPPGALRSLKFAQKVEPSVAMASGWMAIRGMRRRSGFEMGFVISDHADWKALNRAVLLSEAERIDATHGYSEIFARFWRERGKDARVLKTDFEGDGD